MSTCKSHIRHGGRFRPEHRYSLYYAVLFGSISAMVPFAALWMSHVGIDAATIGLIVAAPSVIMLLTTMALGRWADSLPDRRLAIIAANWIILLAHLILFFLSTGLWVVLLVWLVSGVMMSAKLPVTDAAALSLAHQKNSDYARMRMFGSIGFVVILTVAGHAYEYAGIGVFVVGLVIADASRLVAAHALPKLPRANAPAPGTSIGVPATPSLYRPGIVLTLAAGALINASHAMVYTYGILLWTTQGLSESLASMAIGIGVLVEIVLMWWFRSLTRNLSARVCLQVAAVCGAVRWLTLAMEPSWVLVFCAQALHGVSFGVTFLACASFISRRVPEASAARGQGLLATLSTACMASATFACGQLFELWGSALYTLMAGLCGAAMLLCLLSYRFPVTDEVAQSINRETD